LGYPVSKQSDGYTTIDKIDLNVLERGYWAEKIDAFFELFCLYLILIGLTCTLIGFNSDDFGLSGFVFEIIVFCAPIFLYSKVIGFYRRQ